MMTSALIRAAIRPPERVSQAKSAHCGETWSAREGGASAFQRSSACWCCDAKVVRGDIQSRPVCICLRSKRELKDAFACVENRECTRQLASESSSAAARRLGVQLVVSYVWNPGFTLPTGPAKPAGSGTGIPDRFGRKPVQTGRSQI